MLQIAAAIKTVDAVVYTSLAAAVLCLVIAVLFVIIDLHAASKVREAAETAAARAKTRQEADPANTAQVNPAQQQAAADFAGIAQLANALEKLNPAGRFLIAAIAFAAIAGATAGIDSVAGGTNSSSATRTVTTTTTTTIGGRRGPPGPRGPRGPRGASCDEEPCS